MHPTFLKHASLLTSDIKETLETFQSVEKSLKLSIPESTKELLIEYGYSDYSGIPNLEECIELTHRCRKALDLPAHYLAIEDKGDGGLVIMDTSSPQGRILWGDYEDFSTSPRNLDQFSSYIEYVVELIKDDLHT